MNKQVISTILTVIIGVSGLTCFDDATGNHIKDIPAAGAKATS